MGTVAEWLVFGLATTAETYNRAPGEAEFLPFSIMNSKISFEANRPIGKDRNFRWHCPDATRSIMNAEAF